MIDGFFFAAIFVPFVIGYFAMIEEIYFIFIPFAIITLAAILWFLIYTQTPWEYDAHTIEIREVFNKDIFILDDEIFNANSLFGKDFEDGERLVVEKAKEKMYVGVYPAVYPGLRIKK